MPAEHMAKDDTRADRHLLRADGDCCRSTDALLCPSRSARHYALTEVDHMNLQLKICRDVFGTWSVDGLSSGLISYLRSLRASVDYARKACDAAPATIEFFVDGLYFVVHQERGWPRSLFAPNTDRAPQAYARSALRGPPISSRFLAWLRHFGSESHTAPSTGQDLSQAAS